MTETQTRQGAARRCTAGIRTGSRCVGRVVAMDAVKREQDGTRHVIRALCCDRCGQAYGPAKASA